VPAADNGSVREDVLGMDSVKILDTDGRGPAGITAETAPSATENELDIKRYQEAILETEKNSGAYGDILWEQLVGLGAAQQNAGLHADAVASLNQALHINRVNHGLHNLEQEPIIDLLIKSNTALSDWKALDQNYQYLYWLYRRVYGEKDIHLLPVIDRVGLWHINAYNQGESNNPLAHLLAAQDLYTDAVHIIETNKSENDPGLIAPLYRIMLTNYLIAHNLSSSYPAQSDLRCSGSLFSRHDPFSDDCNYARGMTQDEVNRQDLFSISYRTGKKALTRIIEVYEKNPALPVTEHAMAYIRLGDWYMLFDRPSSAISTYAMAYTMVENIDSAVREKLFGAPRSLPETQPFLNGNDARKPAQKYVVVTMDITDTGKVRNVQVVESHPPNDDHMIFLVRNSLNTARFAPRFENGEPVPTSGYRKKFVFE